MHYTFELGLFFKTQECLLAHLQRDMVEGYANYGFTIPTMDFGNQEQLQRLEHELEMSLALEEESLGEVDTEFGSVDASDTESDFEN